MSESDMSASRDASCSCGQLRVECFGPPASVSVCHCLECQKRTGSPFGAQARFPITKVRRWGRSQTYTRRGESGGQVEFQFCPECGATVFWQPDGLREFLMVALGSFADPSFPTPDREVYEDRAHGWVPRITQGSPLA